MPAGGALPCCSREGSGCLQLEPSPWAGDFASVINQANAAGGWGPCKTQSIPAEILSLCRR